MRPLNMGEKRYYFWAVTIEENTLQRLAPTHLWDQVLSPRAFFPRSGML